MLVSEDETVQDKSGQPQQQEVARQQPQRDQRRPGAKEHRRQKRYPPRYAPAQGISGMSSRVSKRALGDSDDAAAQNCPGTVAAKPQQQGQKALSMQTQAMHPPVGQESDSGQVARIFQNAQHRIKKRQQGQEREDHSQATQGTPGERFDRSLGSQPSQFRRLSARLLISPASQFWRGLPTE